MEIHDESENELAFKSLITYLVKQGLTDETVLKAIIENYMYMGHDEEHYYYKHLDTREYVVLTHLVDGKELVLVRGKIEGSVDRGTVLAEMWAKRMESFEK